MSYRDPDLSGKWLSEAEWRSYNDNSDKYKNVDSRLTIRRLVEEVKKLNEKNEHLQSQLDKCSEQEYQQLAEDEEWLDIQRAKLNARKTVSKDKLVRIGSELIPRFFATKSEAVKTLQRIKSIVEE